jgi:PKD repeat protein
MNHWISTLMILLSITTASAQATFEPPMDRLYENRLVAESSRVLSINLFDVPIDHAKAKDPTQFTITSPDDPNYAAGKTVHPTASGSRTRAVRVSIRKELLVKQTAIFLQLPQPLKNGCSYDVAIADIGAANLPDLPAIAFDDTKQINDNIRLNQLGYLPDYAKHAYVGQYMGDAGPMPLSADSFEILDAAGKVVHTGTPRPRTTNNNLVGQQVVELDFTAFKTPGTYRLRVPGIGLSYDFVIGDNALNPLYVNYMRGHYHQRCGHAVDAAHSRHPREACHLDDAFIDAKAEQTNFTNPKNPPFYPTNYDGRKQKATGGHHDAGDYGKYTITGAAYVFSALQAMEAYPDKFREDNTGLPWSGNGIPDLLEEVKWELDWLENMQDESDGGVFGVIRPENGGYEHTMPQPHSRRLMFPKDTVFTAAYAGALARAARSPEMRQHYPDAADRYLAKARKAWSFLEKNDRFVQYFHYGAVFGDWDERCWAAVELYAATGEKPFHDYFVKNFDPQKKRWDWWPMFEASGYATHAYLFLKDRDRDPAMVKRCEAALKEACDMHVRHSEQHPYRLSMPEPSVRYGDYGWIFPGDLAAFDLILGHAIHKNDRYLQVAYDNLAYTCGANPGGYFLATGLGSKRNIEVVSDYANNDGIIEPIPGIPLGIGSAGFYGLHQYGKRIAEGTYPEKDWPLLNRWYDGFNVSTEFTMGPMMRETIAAAFFADLAKAQAKRPTVTIVAEPASGPAPLTVKFTAKSDRPLRQVFWDFGDETFSSQPAPTRTFAEAGRQYPVAVHVIDENGYDAYASTEILTTMSNAGFAQEPHIVNEDTIALFHFDGDLKSATARDFELTPVAKKAAEHKPFRFSDHGPAWMSQPAGACLVLDGAEHFTVTIPADLLPEPGKTPLTLEMMVNVEQFAGWGYSGDPLVLGIHNDWDSQLALKQGSWDKANAPQFGSAVSSEKFAKDFPRNQWTHVRITYDPAGKSELFVNGKSWGAIDGPTLKPDLDKPLTLSVGPLRGMIDELRLKKGLD